MNASTMTMLLIAVILLAAVIIIFLLLYIYTHKKKEKKREAEIRFRDELFGILANNTESIFLVISDEGSKAEYVSPNIKRLLGVDPEDAKQDLYSIQMPTYIDGTPPTREELLAIPLGYSSIKESRRTHKITGEIIAFEEYTYHVLINGLDRFVTVLSDRTADRKLRTSLEKALADANASNEAKSIFLSNASHDLRTPLSAIIGLTELLDKEIDNPNRVREYVKKLKTSSQLLLRLINDILDMSKMESGNTHLQLEEFYLKDVVDEVALIVSPEVQKRKQQLTIDFDSNIPSAFLGDKLRISQILTNILSNAIKYTPDHGTIRFAISCPFPIASSTATVTVRFVVTDNGIGISEDFMAQIFKPFTREIQKEGMHVQGTGLGMPIAKSLVELMNGTISVRSALGEGSEFTVDLPLTMQEPTLPAKSETAFTDIAGLHFLVAEDVEINAEVLRALLEAKGATCDIASNGQEAVSMFKAAPESYDAILMDVQMPVMNGYEATRIIRDLNYANATVIPIIAMTAHTFAKDTQDALSAGMNAHLAKPATIDQLCSALGNLTFTNNSVDASHDASTE